MAKGGPRMIDPSLFIEAGIDPKTGLPKKLIEDGISPCDVLENLRIIDRQDAMNCFSWYNLPDDITPQLIERILYYRGQGMFFYLEEVDQFIFLPYCLDGDKNIDMYGRFRSVTPLPFNGSTSIDGENDEPWIEGLVREPAYKVELPEDYIDEEGNFLLDKVLETQKTKCVLLKDFTEGISQTNPRRVDLQEPVLQVMSDMLPFARTSLLNATGVQGMRVNNNNEAAQVELASRAINTAALKGKKWVPITSNLEFQELTSGATGKAEEFFLALQSLDNFRLSLYGLDNGGLFQKKSHLLAEEQEVNQGNVGLILRDRLEQRQKFCSIVNSIWGLNIWCDISETVIGVDRDGDMAMGSNEDQGSNGQTSGLNNGGYNNEEA